jgi:glycosyltransferase involved in cell wall biosynthesis
MKLVASVICRNELGRYLEPCIDHLLEFCDAICVLDDGSTDRGPQLIESDRVVISRSGMPGRHLEPAFHRHAGLRNQLLNHTLARDPSHVLAIDADEFVADGAAVRAACERDDFDAWNLCMQEVWNAHSERLEIRQDGGWDEHDVPMLWAPGRLRGALRITDKGHATGRVPDAVYGARMGYSCTEVLHFGWARKAEREERFARYAVGDAGRFHAAAHIESIMWPDERVRLTARAWPVGLDDVKDAILEHANGESRDPRDPPETSRFDSDTARRR